MHHLVDISPRCYHFSHFTVTPLTHHHTSARSGPVTKNTPIRFLVRVSYLEIYNEEVRDLLGKSQSQRLEVKERPDIGVYVKDLSAFVVNNADDMDKIMTLGNKNSEDRGTQ